MVQFLSINVFSWISSIFVGFFKSFLCHPVVTLSETRLRQVYREIEKKTQRVGLIVNEKKSKYLMGSATQKGRQTQNLKVGVKVFERVSSFEYLDNVINKDRRISEYIKDRIQVGNRAYAAN